MIEQLFTLTSLLAFSPWLATPRFRNLSRSKCRVACHLRLQLLLLFELTALTRVPWNIDSAITRLSIFIAMLRTIWTALNPDRATHEAVIACSWYGIDIIRSSLDTAVVTKICQRFASRRTLGILQFVSFGNTLHRLVPLCCVMLCANSG